MMAMSSSSFLRVSTLCGETFLSQMWSRFWVRAGYLEGLVGLDHVVEGVDGEVVVDDLLLALGALVGEAQVDVDDLLDLHAGVLDLQEDREDLLDHLRVEEVVVALLEVVLLQNALGKLPDRLLDMLRLGGSTFTRMRIIWSR
jgi:hypothetical protein